MGFNKRKFIAQYKAETQEHLQRMSDRLLLLEKNPDDRSLLETLMREAHTIKGSSAMIGYKRIADVAHAMEDGLEKVLEGKVKLEKAHVDALFRCIDAIPLLIEDKVTWDDSGVNRPFVDELCKEIEGVFQEQVSRRGEEKRPKKSEAKKSAGEPVAAIPKPEAITSAPLTEGSIRVDIRKLDKLMNLSGELLISKIRLDELSKSLSLKAESDVQIREDFSNLIQELTKVDSSIDFITKGLEDEVLRLRMISVAYLFGSFPRAVRDLANEKGKDVQILIKGEETELDKSIIDELKGPIMHILRNAIDHGIEPPEERIAKGKPRTGLITLSASQKGSQVVIEVSDDGNGIDRERVRREAVKRGLISEEKARELGDEQIYSLLFMPGFSTCETVTEVSGRGVGLDVVRENISRLKGIVEVYSTPGQGSRFVMKVPLTLGITESLFVACGNETFALPIENVVETIRVNQGEIRTIEGKEAITLRGQILPLLRLNDVFNLSQRGIAEKKVFPVVVVQSVEKRIGLMVDLLLGRQEIVRKNLNGPLRNVRGISGATIIGDGRVILILDVPQIVENVESVMIKKVQFASKPAPRKKHKTVLLAEDTLSTAMLEKNILESAGFSVVIARDGQEAFEKASQERFDLVITDVLMPRMDGFELTLRLKKDHLYKDVPIIIVTTRESEANKRWGLEAGADAYILKSEFTAEGLLETIERLIG
ncbi:MAG: hybrid sensor histidine kinase/response regulator [Syntrophaceae bacterium]|nr:hybrid sensor histidine kinase/response regulator [Syntrophaceae bacterium]